MYLDKQGASVFHPWPSSNRTLNKTSQRMTCLSTHLALLQVVSCHTEIELKLSVVDHNWCHTSNFHFRMTYPWNVGILSARQSQSLDWWRAFQWLSSIGICWKSGYHHAEEDLTKCGYTTNMMYKSWIILLYFWLWHWKLLMEI